MTFEERLRAVVAPYEGAPRQDRDEEMQAADIVALHAPYLLRHFAEMATVFDAPELRSGQGAIFARRDDKGYTFVEYKALALHITFDVIDGETLLCWITEGEIVSWHRTEAAPLCDFTNSRRITAETPSCVFDAMLMDAVSAFINTRPAILPTMEARELEAQHV